MVFRLNRGILAGFNRFLNGLFKIPPFGVSKQFLKISCAPKFDAARFLADGFEIIEKRGYEFGFHGWRFMDSLFVTCAEIRSVFD